MTAPTIRPATRASHTGVGTSTQDALERRQAARTLLAHPVLSSALHPEPMASIRRHAPALKQAFQSTLGYTLVVESSFARLVKHGVSADTSLRPALRSAGQPFTPRGYAYLALVSAALLAPGTGEQLLLSQLVEQVRADAVTAGVPVDDSHAESRQLVHAIQLLVDWGVLTETEGTVTSWGLRQEEALLDVHRVLLPHLLTGSLADVADPAVVTDPQWRSQGGVEQPRRSLRRKLVENPLVRRQDLTDAERDVLSRERTELARVLEDTFGLTLEVRLEGALAYDADGELSDIAFPGTGTVRHCALMLISALADDLKAGPESTVELDGRTVPGALAPWTLLEENVALLISRYGLAFGKSYTDDPAMLTDEIVSLLDAVSLARRTDDGLVLHPACGRYRPEPHTAPARTRAAQRLDADDTTPRLFEET